MVLQKLGRLREAAEEQAKLVSLLEETAAGCFWCCKTGARTSGLGLGARLVFSVQRD